MQDRRHILISDRKAVLGMPIKLLIVMVILTISIPIVHNALDVNNESMMETKMNQECDRITDCIRDVYYSGIGSVRTIDIDLPQGCELVIGGKGADAYCMTSYYEGKRLSTSYMDEPVVRFADELSISNDTRLRIGVDRDGGEYVIEVSVV